MSSFGDHMVLCLGEASSEFRSRGFPSLLIVVWSLSVSVVRTLLHITLVSFRAVDPTIPLQV